MKIHTKQILSLALVLVLLCGILPLQASAYTVTTDVIIEPKYEDANVFSDGYAAVQLGGKWGFIDEKGTMVIEPKYEWVSYTTGGYTIALLKEMVTVPWEAEPQEMLAMHLIGIDGTDITLMDHNAEFVFEVAFPICFESMEDFYGSEKYNYWGYNGEVVYVSRQPFDVKGNPIVPKNTDVLAHNYDYFTQINPCVDGLIPMEACFFGSVDSSQCFLMDLEGNIVKTFTPAYDGDENPGIDWIYAPNDGLMVAYQEILQKHEESDGYVWYERVNDVGGIMDMDGNWVAGPQFTRFSLFTSGQYFNDGIMCRNTTESSLLGGVNTKGEVVIPFEYDLLTSFANGYSAARKDGRYIYVDASGNEYQIAGPDGGIANITAASTFSELGIAAVYDADTDTCYCISTDAMNGILPVVHGSEEAGFGSYFLDTDEDGDVDLTVAPEEIIVIERDGKYGYAKLDLGYLNPFTDLDVNKFYYTPVLWAVDKGITTGKTTTEFQPNGECTRAQVVTFLWRAAGEPEPTLTENPFTDVKEGAYYYKAVLWAVENGITTGKTATTFEPTSPCTRAQVVTFLWRYADEPVPESEANPFGDVGDNAYYYKAVLWAGEEDITKGQTATSFAPTNTCTRGHIVTFLYRFIVE